MNYKKSDVIIDNEKIIYYWRIKITERLENTINRSRKYDLISK
jgi:hypothetical protein